MHAVVCDWKSWGKHLVSVLLPEADVVPIQPLQGAHSLLAKACAGGIRPDLVLLHLDNTFPAKIFPELEEFAGQARRAGIQVWNHRIGDISKRTVQAHNVACGLPSTSAGRQGAASEQLIVKTDVNHHGVSESRVTVDERRILGWPPYRRTPISPWPDYPVLPRADIPAEWWSDPRLCIERFVVNAEGTIYRVYLVGESCVVRAGSGDPSVRRLEEARDYRTYLLLRSLAADDVTGLLLGEATSAAFGCAVRFARSFGVDYGTIDLVVDDGGKAYVVDFNACPFWGVDDGNDGVDGDTVIAHLAAGAWRAAVGEPRPREGGWRGAPSVAGPR